MWSGERFWSPTLITRGISVIIVTNQCVFADRYPEDFVRRFSELIV